MVIFNEAARRVDRSKLEGYQLKVWRNLPDEIRWRESKLRLEGTLERLSLRPGERQKLKEFWDLPQETSDMRIAEIRDLVSKKRGDGNYEVVVEETRDKEGVVQAVYITKTRMAPLEVRYAEPSKIINFHDAVAEMERAQ